MPIAFINQQFMGISIGSNKDGLILPQPGAKKTSEKKETDLGKKASEKEPVPIPGFLEQATAPLKAIVGETKKAIPTLWTRAQKASKPQEPTNEISDVPLEDEILSADDFRELAAGNKNDEVKQAWEYFVNEINPNYNLAHVEVRRDEIHEGVYGRVYHFVGWPKSGVTQNGEPHDVRFVPQTTRTLAANDADFVGTTEEFKELIKNPSSVTPHSMRGLPADRGSEATITRKKVLSWANARYTNNPRSQVKENDIEFVERKVRNANGQWVTEHRVRNRYLRVVGEKPDQPHGGGEGEAPAALPMEGATRAPIIEEFVFWEGKYKGSAEGMEPARQENYSLTPSKKSSFRPVIVDGKRIKGQKEYLRSFGLDLGEERANHINGTPAGYGEEQEKIRANVEKSTLQVGRTLERIGDPYKPFWKKLESLATRQLQIHGNNPQTHVSRMKVTGFHALGDFSVTAQVKVEAWDENGQITRFLATTGNYGNPEMVLVFNPNQKSTFEKRKGQWETEWTQGQEASLNIKLIPPELKGLTREQYNDIEAYKAGRENISSFWERGDGLLAEENSKSYIDVIHFYKDEFGKPLAQAEENLTQLMTHPEVPDFEGKKAALEEIIVDLKELTTQKEQKLYGFLNRLEQENNADLTSFKSLPAIYCDQINGTIVSPPLLFGKNRDGKTIIFDLATGSRYQGADLDAALANMMALHPYGVGYYKIKNPDSGNVQTLRGFTESDLGWAQWEKRAEKAGNAAMCAIAVSKIPTPHTAVVGGIAAAGLGAFAGAVNTIVGIRKMGRDSQAGREMDGLIAISTLASAVGLASIPGGRFLKEGSKLKLLLGVGSLSLDAAELAATAREALQEIDENPNPEARKELRKHLYWSMAQQGALTVYFNWGDGKNLLRSRKEDAVHVVETPPPPPAGPKSPSPSGTDSQPSAFQDNDFDATSKPDFATTPQFNPLAPTPPAPRRDTQPQRQAHQAVAGGGNDVDMGNDVFANNPGAVNPNANPNWADEHLPGRQNRAPVMSNGNSDETDLASIRRPIIQVGGESHGAPAGRASPSPQTPLWAVTSPSPTPGSHEDIAMREVQALLSGPGAHLRDQQFGNPEASFNTETGKPFGNWASRLEQLRAALGTKPRGSAREFFDLAEVFPEGVPPRPEFAPASPPGSPANPHMAVRAATPPTETRGNPTLAIPEGSTTYHFARRQDGTTLSTDTETFKLAEGVTLVANTTLADRGATLGSIDLSTNRFKQDQLSLELRVEFGLANINGTPQGGTIRLKSGDRITIGTDTFIVSAHFENGHHSLTISRESPGSTPPSRQAVPMREFSAPLKNPDGTIPPRSFLMNNKGLGVDIVPKAPQSKTLLGRVFSTGPEKPRFEVVLTPGEYPVQNISVNGHQATPPRILLNEGSNEITINRPGGGIVTICVDVTGGENPSIHFHKEQGSRLKHEPPVRNTPAPTPPDSPKPARTPAPSPSPRQVVVTPKRPERRVDTGPSVIVSSFYDLAGGVKLETSSTSSFLQIPKGVKATLDGAPISGNVQLGESRIYGLKINGEAIILQRQADGTLAIRK